MLGTMTSKGQTTIPKEIRERLELKPGDRLVWSLEDGRAVLRRKNRSIRELAGYLERPGRKAATLKEIDQSVAAEAARSALPHDRPRHKRSA